MTEGIDTSSAMGRFIFHIMSGLAEMERELIRERTLAGLAAARAQGRVGGRPVKMTDSYIEQARALLQNGATRKQVADIFDISISTIYRLIPPQDKNICGNEYPVKRVISYDSPETNKSGENQCHLLFHVTP